jgi:hypothetical protein
MEFLESAFAAFGNGILGQMFAKCAKFATQKVVKLGTKLITIYFNPPIAVASSMEVGWASKKASKSNKQFINPRLLDLYQRAPWQKGRKPLQQ